MSPDLGPMRVSKPGRRRRRKSSALDVTNESRKDRQRRGLDQLTRAVDTTTILGSTTHHHTNQLRAGDDGNKVGGCPCRGAWCASAVGWAMRQRRTRERECEIARLRGQEGERVSASGELHCCKAGASAVELHAARQTRAQVELHDGCKLQLRAQVVGYIAATQDQAQVAS